MLLGGQMIDLGDKRVWAGGKWCPTVGDAPPAPPPVIDVAAEIASRKARTKAAGIPDPATNGNRWVGYEHVGPTIGLALTKRPKGDMYVVGDTTVVRGMFIEGRLAVRTPNVLVEDCIIHSSADPKVFIDTTSGRNGRGLTLNRCEVYGNIRDGGTALGWLRFTASYCYFHDCEDGARLGIDVNIDHCLFDRQSDGILNESTGERLHADAVQVVSCNNSSTESSTVTNSTLLGWRASGWDTAGGPVDGVFMGSAKGNSAFIIGSELGEVRNVTFENNYLAGGSYSAMLKTPGAPGATSAPRYMENIRVANNVFAGDAKYGDICMPRDSHPQRGSYIVEGNVRKDGTPATIDRWSS
jgi:hypothetical protein